MARVLATWRPGPGERELLHDLLGDELAWQADGAPTSQAEALLTFFPRRELRAARLDWKDLPRLRLVKCATAGLNHLPWRDWPRLLAVASTPGATGPFIAEYVLGAIIGWARGMWYHTQEIRHGRFHQGAPVRALSELRVGLVGFGGIGRATAKALHPFGATLCAVSRSADAPDEDRARLAWLGTLSDLPRLVRESDVVVLCLPLQRNTVGLVDIDVLSGMSGRPALLINVARGHLVKEEDLHAWLDSDGTRHFAVLDVWWKYPKDEGRPFSEAFHKLPNVIMTPHNSPNVTGFRLAMLKQAAKDLRHWLDTGEVLHRAEAEAHVLDVDGDAR